MPHAPCTEPVRRQRPALHLTQLAYTLPAITDSFHARDRDTRLSRRSKAGAPMNQVDAGKHARAGERTARLAQVAVSLSREQPKYKYFRSTLQESQNQPTRSQAPITWYAAQQPALLKCHTSMSLPSDALSRDAQSASLLNRLRISAYNPTLPESQPRCLHYSHRSEGQSPPDGALGLRSNNQ